MKRILIVEDEAALAEGLKFNFEQEGYEVLHVEDGPSALDVLRDSAAPVSVVILDLMLPSMSGYEVCRRIREFNIDVPILVLSARTLSEDKMLAFDAGTDQYMTKPFALPELIARVRNLIERRGAMTTAKPAATATVYEFDDVKIDFGKFQLTSQGVTHTLTTMEMQLMRYFTEHEGLVLSRNQILRDVWEETADITTRSIDNFVLRLRKMIEPDPTEPRYLLSVRGTGYRFVARHEAEG